ncbi:TlpA family protein disulfide reductase [Sphingobacterium lumbrici]|uniref:TlpA family protein disulfide reductase n=1 Tax=Sphingobacterium lumbrici TaxID=2559600 RepID=UPI00112D5E2E|nr:TlpA disulfide reductase family protein [Sphingobacterium lumbrici]
MRFKHLAILFFALSTGGQAFAQKPVEIKGQLAIGKEIRLYQTDAGAALEVAKIQAKEDGSFRFSFFPDYEGIYVLQTSASSAPNSEFYLKEGDVLDVTLNELGYELQGANNSKENQILEAWEAQSLLLSMELNSPEDYMSKLNAAAKLYAEKNKSKNKQFDHFLPQYLKWNIAQHSNSLAKGFKITDYTRSAHEVYALPNGLKTLKRIIQLEAAKSGKIKEGMEGLKSELASIQNDTLKGDIVLNYMAELVSYRGFNEAASQCSAFFVTKKQQQDLEKYKLKFSNFTPGDMGFEFAYPDKNGKIVKLSDFKGKVVVVDVWATWCGPCLKEVPHLRKLEESLAGKDVVFIGMSTDKDKDKNKWEEMIEEEAMKGSIHILAGPTNEFSKFYKISSIPRFLVFDKKGNLVTANSPRPSDPKLKKIIEEELKVTN